VDHTASVVEQLRPSRRTSFDDHVDTVRLGMALTDPLHEVRHTFEGALRTNDPTCRLVTHGGRAHDLRGAPIDSHICFHLFLSSLMGSTLLRVSGAYL